MIITLIDKKEPAKIQTNLAGPDLDSLEIVADSIRLIGTTLDAIQISVNGGSSYMTLDCDNTYSGKVYVKSNLYSLKGYRMDLKGGAQISGKLSDFGTAPDLFSDNVMDISNLIIDVNECAYLFSNSLIENGPVFRDNVYDFSGMFYGNAELKVLDFRNISVANLEQCNFTDFCSVNTVVRLPDDTPKELIALIDSSRYDNKK